MYCIMAKEFPKRAKTASGKVVHAAREYISRAHSAYKFTAGSKELIDFPERILLYAACGQTSSENLKEIANTEPITCKSCMKAMDMHEKASFNVRHVLVEKESGYFYRKAGYRKNWVKNFADATLYKVRAAAENNGIITEFFSDDGNKISHEEFYEVSYQERRAKGFNTKRRFVDEKYELKEVHLTLK